MVNLEIVELQKRGFTLLPLLISHTPRPLSRQQFRLSVMPTSQAFSATRPINPPGVEPVLSEDQVWKGLQIKARAPQEFVKMSVRYRLTWTQTRAVRGHPILWLGSHLCLPGL